MSWELPEYIEATPQNTHSTFKYCIGETVKTPSSNIYIKMQIRLPNGKNKKTGNINYSKGYIYQCEKCNYIGTRKESKIERYDCPVCNGSETKWNVNSVAVLYPNFISLFFNPEDSYSYSPGSHQKVDFICPDCGSLLKNKQIKNVINQGLFCPFCSDGVPIGERIMREFLNELNEPYIMHKNFIWSDRRSYDFYLPQKNLLIEMQGQQHSALSNSDFSSIGGRTWEQEMENDEYKLFLAEKNGYQIAWIDCSKSDFDYIKYIIQTNLDLAQVKFDIKIVDWKKIQKRSCKSMIIKCAELWNDLYNSKEIMNIVNYSSSAINNWLMNANKLGLCSNYNKTEADNRRSRKIIDLKTLNCYWSVKDFGERHGINPSIVYSYAYNHLKDLMFLDEYVLNNNIPDPHVFFKQHLVQEQPNGL
jgi:Zn finger protein HypA/HybF involved in hydrogenase expression